MSFIIIIYLFISMVCAAFLFLWLICFYLFRNGSQDYKDIISNTCEPNGALFIFNFL